LLPNWAFLQFCDIANLAKISQKLEKLVQPFYTLKMIISQVRNIRSPVSVHLAKSARLHLNPKIKAAILLGRANPSNMSSLSLAAHSKNSQIAGSLDNFVRHWCLSSLKSFVALHKSWFGWWSAILITISNYSRFVFASKRWKLFNFIKKSSIANFDIHYSFIPTLLLDFFFTWLISMLSIYNQFVLQ